jgi:hypothetical protein
MAMESESASQADPNIVRADHVIALSSQVLVQLQGVINAVLPGNGCSDPGCTTAAEATLALAIAVGVVGRILSDAMTPAQIEFAKKVSAAFTLAPMPVDTQV